MVHYRRMKIKGGMYSLTVTLRDRSSAILTQHIHIFRDVIRSIKLRHPFNIKAISVMPDHFHTIWHLPEDSDDYSMRLRLIKSYFTREVAKIRDDITKDYRGEYNLWQRRFWEHTIRNDKDFEDHVNYIHYNPVKHGLVRHVRDWPYSSFHRFVRDGILSPNWSDGGYISKLKYEVE